MSVWHLVWLDGIKVDFGRSIVLALLYVDLTFFSEWSYKFRCYTCPVKSLSANLCTPLDLFSTNSSLWFIRSKDKLVCGASVQWGILLFKSQMTPSLPLSLPPSPFPSLTVCILPIYAALGSSLLFLLERKRTRQARDKKIALRQNSLSLKLPGEVEEWKVPRPPHSAERLSKNGANHVAARAGESDNTARQQDKM